MKTVKTSAFWLLAGQRLLLCLAFVGLLAILPVLRHSALGNLFLVRAWQSGLTDVRLDGQAQAVLDDPVRLVWQLGVQALARGDHAGAIRALEDGLQHAPAHPMLEGLLAQAYYESGDYTNAGVYWRRIGAAAPLYAMGDQALKAERFAEAIQLLESSLAINPKQPQAHYFLAYAYNRLGNPQRAVAEAQEAVQMDGGRNLGYRSTLAWIYEMTGDPDRAYAEYLAILSVSPDHQQAQEGLSRVEKTLKEKRQ